MLLRTMKLRMVMILRTTATMMTSATIRSKHARSTAEDINARTRLTVRDLAIKSSTRLAFLVSSSEISGSFQSFHSGGSHHLVSISR